MNPLLNSQAIAVVYEEDPEGAKADYGPQFRSDISSYISPETVDQLIAYGCHERAPVEAVTYNAFADMPGGSWQ